MQNLTLHTPSNVGDAASAMNDDAKFIAGGQTLIPTMKAGLTDLSALVSLGGIGDLSGITVEGDTITIGAMTTHAEVASSAELAAACPGLADLAAGIGDAAVRHRGTIGGSVANNDPAADYPAAMLALDATITTNKRSLGAADFFVGMFETALDDGEMITSVSFSKPEKAAYAKFPNPASRYALTGVFVAKTGGGARVAVTGAGEGGVFRQSAMEAALDNNWSSDAASSVSVSADGLLQDIHANADYRANLIKVMAGRAIAKA